MEEKLKLSANNLPQPHTDYLSLEETAKQSSQKHILSRRRKWLSVTLALIVLLLGATTVGAATTEIDMCMWATFSLIPMQVEHRLGIQIPKSLGDSDYLSTTNLHTVPKGTTYLEAILNPVYRWYSIKYGTRVEVVEENGDRGTKTTWDTLNPYELDVGSTKNELWKYTFCFTDEGVWERSDILPETYRTEEYNGITVYSGTKVHYYEPIEGWDHTSITTYLVVWVDEANHTLFSLSTEVYDTDSIVPPPELLEYAKQIIDLNK